MEYEVVDGGCIYRTAGSSYSIYSLQLPDGAEIKYFRLFFYDNDPVYNAKVYLYRYDGTGTLIDPIQEVSSSGTPGQSSVGSDYFNHEVDNYNESLTLVLHFGYGAVGSNVKIFGVRVQYKYHAIFGSFFPLIER